MTNALTPREIILRNGMKTLVDSQDYERLARYSWLAVKLGNYWYAYRVVQTRSSTHPDGQRNKKVWLHREITDAPRGKIVDHINRDGLDNRRCNLRICTTALNVANGRARKTGFRGVYPDRKKWCAKISAGPGKMSHLGNYETQEAAARAYDTAAHVRYGEFANLNFPHEVAP